MTTVPTTTRPRSPRSTATRSCRPWCASATPTPAWTPGVLEAEPGLAALYPATLAEAKALAKTKALAGAWLVQPPSLPKATREKLDAALEPAGIAGIVRAAQDDAGKLVHTSGR